MRCNALAVQCLADALRINASAFLVAVDRLVEVRLVLQVVRVADGAHDERVDQFITQLLAGDPADALTDPQHLLPNSHDTAGDLDFDLPVFEICLDHSSTSSPVIMSYSFALSSRIVCLSA